MTSNQIVHSQCCVEVMHMNLKKLKMLLLNTHIVTSNITKMYDLMVSMLFNVCFFQLAVILTAFHNVLDAEIG